MSAITLRQIVTQGIITGKDLDFALSLLSARTASPRQEYWMGELVTRYTTPRAAQVPEQLAATAAGIFTLFATAQAAGLQRPKIHLQAQTGKDMYIPVVFALAGARSKYAGQVLITDGGAYGSNRYYGRITQDGGLVASREMRPEIRAIVDAFAAEPATVAKAYGRRTGTCCFCSRHLETRESVAVGYGPICAEKFGLPWGEVRAPAEEEVSLAERIPALPALDEELRVGVAPSPEQLARIAREEVWLS
jgi:hypothetical protein